MSYGSDLKDNWNWFREDFKRDPLAGFVESVGWVGLGGVLNATFGPIGLYIFGRVFGRRKKPKRYHRYYLIPIASEPLALIKFGRTQRITTSEINQRKTFFFYRSKLKSTKLAMKANVMRTNQLHQPVFAEKKFPDGVYKKKITTKQIQYDNSSIEYSLDRLGLQGNLVSFGIGESSFEFQCWYIHNFVLSRKGNVFTHNRMKLEINYEKKSISVISLARDITKIEVSIDKEITCDIYFNESCLNVENTIKLKYQVGSDKYEKDLTITPTDSPYTYTFDTNPLDKTNTDFNEFSLIYYEKNKEVFEIKRNEERPSFIKVGDKMDFRSIIQQQYYGKEIISLLTEQVLNEALKLSIDGSHTIDEFDVRKDLAILVKSNEVKPQLHISEELILPENDYTIILPVVGQEVTSRQPIEEELLGLPDDVIKTGIQQAYFEQLEREEFKPLGSINIEIERGNNQATATVTNTEVYILYCHIGINDVLDALHSKKWFYAITKSNDVYDVVRKDINELYSQTSNKISVPMTPITRQWKSCYFVPLKGAIYNKHMNQPTKKKRRLADRVLSDPQYKPDESRKKKAKEKK